HDRLVASRVETDALDLADAHSRHRHGRPALQIPDVVELGSDVIARGRAREPDTVLRQLSEEKEQRGKAAKHEQAGADLEGTCSTHDRILRLKESRRQ